MKRLAIIVAVVALSAFVVGSAVNLCADTAPSQAGIVSVRQAQGPLRVGGGSVAFALTGGMPIAGYSPWRRASGIERQAPPGARALVFEVSGTRVGLVSLDTLLASPSVVAKIRAAFDFTVWVIATHAHSGPGGSDARRFAQLTAVGLPDEVATAAMVSAATEALAAAQATLAPTRFSLSHDTISQRVWARSSAAVDERLTTARFTGNDGAVTAEVLILAAHPTLVARSSTLFDGDYPRRLAGDDGVVRLILQGSAGNASAAAENPTLFLERLAPTLAARTFEEVPMPLRLSLSLGVVSLGSPRPLPAVPALFRALARNAMCVDASPTAEIGALQLGPLRLLAVPFEPSAEAGTALEAASGVTRVVSLANGYEGYLEPASIVAHQQGEAALQYYQADTLARVTQTAESMAAAFDSPSR